MKFERVSGILIHPSSFPNNYGIGDLGPNAFEFLDFLNESGCKLWQVLPLGPTGYGNSPYQCFSAFAGNPYLISPEILLQEGFLHPNDLVEEMDFPKSRVDYGRIIPWKLNILEKSFEIFSTGHKLNDEYNKFCNENGFWLEDYSLFMTLKEIYGGKPWTYFPSLIRTREANMMLDSKRELKRNINRYKFYQFLFFRQWRSLLTYAHKLGIKVIGDIPLYVAHDSSDVWANPELFQLDNYGQPSHVAGVPPDYFSPTGQLWGNPIFNWKEHKANGYKWWNHRIIQTLQLFDFIRLDHFRGFVAYWQVPFGNPTAQLGEWVQGPGIDFFNQLSKGLNLDGKFPFIAEDLGVITEDVIKLRDNLNIPGMKILQFAFSGPENIFLPHNYVPNCVVYTGSHDNDTTWGWYDSASERERKFANEYLDVDGSDFTWDLIRSGWASVANCAIAPMQDILTLNSSARMNFPGRVEGNWEWRMTENYNQEDLIERIKKINSTYGR